jgi:hypothetical protein
MIEGPLLIIQGLEDEVSKPDSTRRLVKRFDLEMNYRELRGGHDLVAQTNPSWQTIVDTVTTFARGVASEVLA